MRIQNGHGDVSFEETMNNYKDFISSLPSLKQSWDDRMVALNENWGK